MHNSLRHATCGRASVFMMMNPIVQLRSRHRMITLQHQIPILWFVKCLAFFSINAFMDSPRFELSRVEFEGMENMMMNIFIKIIDLGRFFAGDMMIMKYYHCIKTFSKHPRRGRFLQTSFSKHHLAYHIVM